MNVTIQKIGRLRPRDSIFYFRSKKQLWRKLNNGEEISVPKEVAEQCKGVIIKDTLTISKAGKKKAKEVMKNAN